MKVKKIGEKKKDPGGKTKKKRHMCREKLVVGVRNADEVTDPMRLGRADGPQADGGDT